MLWSRVKILIGIIAQISCENFVKKVFFCPLKTIFEVYYYKRVCKKQYSEDCKIQYSEDCKIQYSEDCKIQYSEDCKIQYSEDCIIQYFGKKTI